MIKPLVSLLAVSAALALGPAPSRADAPADQSLAALDAQSRLAGESFALRAQALNDRIARGWQAASVRALMGEPERVQRRVEGADRIEIWGYAGFDVRVQFRNGLVESWFVRFAN
jgi:hypothetical protein